MHNTGQADVREGIVSVVAGFALFTIQFAICDRRLEVGGSKSMGNIRYKKTVKIKISRFGEKNEKYTTVAFLVLRASLCCAHLSHSRPSLVLLFATPPLAPPVPPATSIHVTTQSSDSAPGKDIRTTSKNVFSTLTVHSHTIPCAILGQFR